MFPQLNLGSTTVLNGIPLQTYTTYEWSRRKFEGKDTLMPPSSGTISTRFNIFEMKHVDTVSYIIDEEKWNSYDDPPVILSAKF